MDIEQLWFFRDEIEKLGSLRSKLKRLLPKTKSQHLREAGERIKQKMVFNHPRAVSLRTGKVTPSRPTEQGKAMASAISAALEGGNVKRVKIF